MLENQKKKILFISDHPLVPSGVGVQAKFLIEGLLRSSDEYSFVCLGGAIKHPDYTPQVVAPEIFGADRWKIIPVDGHGSKDILRSVLHAERPTAVVIFTDPRFFHWLYEMEDEVRSFCPLLYWHVWDNDPLPTFNRPLYDSTDHVVALSMKTYGMLRGMGYDRCSYIPHGLPHELFKPLPPDQVLDFKKKHYGPHAEREFVLMWNNRNARRKQTGDVIEAFAGLAEEVGRDRVALFMHTQAKDPEGQDILALAERFGVQKQLLLSQDRVPPETLNGMYNVADCTINIASNEGFGLGTLESLFAGTPIVVHFTGGLQYQVGDWWNGLKDFTDQERLTAYAKKNYESGIGSWWGVPIFSSVRNCVGSQSVPWIYDDRCKKDDVVRALVKVFKMGPARRKEVGLRAREWAKRYFDVDDVVRSWDALIRTEIARRAEFGPPTVRVVKI